MLVGNLYTFFGEMTFFILRPSRCYVTKLSLNLENQSAHQGGKAHHLYVHESELGWAVAAVLK